MKVKEYDGSICYVQALNSSDSASPEDVLNAPEPVCIVSTFLTSSISKI